MAFLGNLISSLGSGADGTGSTSASTLLPWQKNARPGGFQSHINDFNSGGLSSLIHDFHTGGTGSAAAQDENENILRTQGFADGGDPPLGVPSIVGEDGPEIIVPKSPITVIPNLTRTMGTQSPMSALRPSGLGAEPPDIPSDAMSPMPGLGSLPALQGTPRPLVTNPRNMLEQMLQSKIDNYENPAAPKGFWGKLAHGLAQTGVWQNSGTEIARRNEEANRENTLGTMMKQDQDQQTVDSETQLRQAETNKMNDDRDNWAEAPSLTSANGKPMEFNKYTGETREVDANRYTPDKFSYHDTDAGPVLFNENSGEAQHLTVDGKPVGAKVKLTQSQPVIGPDGKPHTYMLDEKGNKVVDLGEHYERPITVNAGQKEQNAVRTAAFKAYTPALDSAERFNVMTNNYEDAIKTHDQQAMLSLLYNHLGMTMGLQKGARMTRDIIREAQNSTPWLQGIQAKFDKDGYLSGVTLTPSQMRQMVSLAQSRYGEDVKKARSEAKYQGATDDGPERDPNDATQRYYLGVTNGDPTKARQLMKADGWTF